VARSTLRAGRGSAGSSMNGRSPLRYRISPHNIRAATALSNHARREYYLAGELKINVY
jgi:hypothetical protein